jgi:hypothetical protein
VSKLRIPAAVTFAVLGGVAAIGLGSAVSCGDDQGPIDGPPVADYCTTYCIPDPPGPDAAICPPCADALMQCPSGCRPVG